MDNPLQQYSQMNQLPSPDSLQTSQPEVTRGADLQKLLQSQTALQNALKAYQGGQGSIGGQGNSQSPLSLWAGLCEKFAEAQVFHKTGLFPSAAAAASHFAQNGQLNPDISKAPANSLIYFHDPNQPDGHVAITDGKGNITGATFSGVKTVPIKNWLAATSQVPLGFVTP